MTTMVEDLIAQARELFAQAADAAALENAKASVRTHVVASPQFRFTRPLIGFERFDEGDLIAIDGDEEIRAPCADCTVLMPTRQPIVGREGVYLSRPLP